MKENGNENEKKEDELVFQVSWEHGAFFFLALVFVAGAFQFYQLKTLDAGLAQDNRDMMGILAASPLATTGAATGTGGANPAQNAVQQGIQDVPDMVGGC